MEEFDKDEILYIIAKLSKYYNNETIEYLKSLANLEISVFKDYDFNTEFYKMDSYLKIVYYNIIFRSVELIKNINDINFNKNNVYVSCNIDNLSIYYQDYNNDSFSLLTTNYLPNREQTEKPNVKVQQIDTIKPGNKTSSLRTLSTLRRDLTNKVTEILLNDWNIEFKEYDKRLFSKDYQKSLSWIDIYKKMQ